LKTTSKIHDRSEAEARARLTELSRSIPFRQNERASVNLICELIDAKEQAPTARFDALTTSGKKLELKFAGICDPRPNQRIVGNLVGNRREWNQYDFLVIGAASPWFHQPWLNVDEYPPYYFFVLPYEWVLGFLDGNPRRTLNFWVGDHHRLIGRPHSAVSDELWYTYRYSADDLMLLR
jgi:hypothetical protein